MLQQTQVERVIAKYREFIERYPTIQHLAKATLADVLRMWKGMGYNRRALYLQKAARVIVDIYKGRFPDTEQELLKLPGLGSYTARAILVFAYRKDIAMVDTNIRQIFTHFFFHDTPQSEKTIQEVVDQLVPKGKSWEWHQALMDYGAMNASEWRHPERSPELVEGRSRGTERITPIFKQSNRFYRGRIVDILRKTDMRKNVLINECINLYGKDAKYYRYLIGQLVREGLVIYKDENRVRLPD